MPVILGIESSCDDTSAAIVKDGILLSNVIANQEVHKEYGGVVPELASRAHQQNIIPVVDQAIHKAGIDKNQIDAIAFTKGPGLLGSLMVGASFAKGFCLARQIPLVDINHLHGHIYSLFLNEVGKAFKHPSFPFLCLLVSGGHTQLIIVKDHLIMETLGQTIDDAAGEAFDKCAKILGLPYPGGPMIDKAAANGDPNAFKFSKPKIPGLDFSFSGLKTSFLYFIREQFNKDNLFIEKNLNDICASIQSTIVDILIKKLILASKETGIKEVAIAGGVAANSGLRNSIIYVAGKREWNIYLPEIRFTTDNAGMIATAGYYKYLKKEFSSLDVSPVAKI